MKKFLLIILSILPIPIGFIMDRLISYFDLAGAGVYLMSFIMILIWCTLGFISSKICDKTSEAIFLGNFTGTFCMILIVLQYLALGQFSFSWIGIVPQMYFLPTMGAVALVDIFNWISSMMMFFVINYIIMIVVYYLGYRVGKRV